MRKRSQAERPTAAASHPEVRFPRPKILTVDLLDSSTEEIAGAGYRVRSGTFGKPYRVPLGDGYQPVLGTATLPEYAEQEIVVINLSPPDVAGTPDGGLTHSRGTTALWAPTDQGVIDPRPKLMLRASDDFNRIYAHGGIFVVFVGPRQPGRYVLARDAGSYRGLEIDVYERDLLHVDSWCFLSELHMDKLTVKRDKGKEISIAEEYAGAASFLQAHLRDARFEATMQPSWQLDGRWLTLAHNKFEEPVAALITPSPDTDEGFILLLPQITRPGALLVEILDSFLPSISPRLFPHVEGAKWVLRPEYELPRVVGLKANIEAVNREARKEIDQLEAAIQEERAANGYLHDLLRTTGTELVSAVETALRRLGFQQVENADRAKEGPGDLREDLRVNDRSPLLLVEIKGISSLPTEADSLQVTKYLAPRMKELKRFDIQGLAVINHQRNLPALDRQNTQTFQPDVVTNANEHGFGLLTTWDLFRLVRNADLHGWTHDQVAPVLYRTGRIEPTPEHFHLIGVVAGVWPQAAAVGVKLEPDVSLSVDDTIAFEGKVDFVVETVTSIQIDNESVSEAPGGSHVGIKVGSTDALRDGMRVFLVRGDDRASARD